jgi:hypothetical protein
MIKGKLFGEGILVASLLILRGLESVYRIILVLCLECNQFSLVEDLPNEAITR